MRTVSGEGVFKRFSYIDPYLFAAALAVSFLGLITMRSQGTESAFFDRQVFWIGIATIVFLISTQIDFSFLRRSPVVSALYGLTIIALAFIYVAGHVAKGAQNQFSLGVFNVQPSDPAKLILVVLLSKYFARRHIEIKHFKHILISGTYTLILMLLIFFQPDLGSAIIVASIWLGMVLVAGISWKHMALLFTVAAVCGVGLWQFALHPYQKARIMTLIHPLTDIHGTGYNAYQATIAVGSGETTGKGIGFGTQSKLKFLPEYQTDFIFAAYAEEWGFLGVVLLFALYGVIIFRILSFARRAGGNFEALFAAGIAVYFIAQFVVHVGMNIGLMPITGATVPFMSYGGSHLFVEFFALGMLMAMHRHGRSASMRMGSEFVGPV